MYLGYQNNKIKFYTEEPLDTLLYNLDRCEETQEEYVLDGEEYVLKDGYWEEKQAKKEAERIRNLRLTKRVLALGLQKKGISYQQLKEIISTNEQAQLEWDLCIDLERKNPLIDIMGLKLGITPDEIDNLFIQANNAETDGGQYNV